MSSDLEQDADGAAGPNRRSCLAGGALIGLGLAGAAMAAPAPPPLRIVSPQTDWEPVPPQAPAREGMADVGGVKLWWWDTGGAGEPVVLSHPATGSGAIWGYQQPVLARAGYRVVGYSRRGHYRSETGPRDNAQSAATDLLRVADTLGIGQFHLVGFAAGAVVVSDLALSHPDRLRSMTVACSVGGVIDPDYAKVSQRMTPEARPPSWFMELGPSYRAANPEGAAAWMALEKIARTGEPVLPKVDNEITWKRVEGIRTPALLVAGDSDLYMPPSRLRDYAVHMPGADAAIIGECGHSAYWEQPRAFNRTLLAFLAKHRRSGKRL